MAIETDLDWFGTDKKKDVNKATIIALTRSANLVQSKAKLLVRKDTGNLRGSIVKAVDTKNLIARVLTNSEYAKYNEFGTGRFAEGGGGRSTPWVYQNSKGQWRWTTGMTAQPFMRPALRDNKKKIKKIFIDEEKKAIDE